MKIDVTTKLELSEQEVSILRGLFSCEEGELADALAPYVRAASREYIDMFTGEGPITTAVDVRERRLVSIIRHAGDGIPSAGLIARLFKMPLNSASTLIRNVAAKHEVKIGPAVRAALHKIVTDAEPEDRDGKPTIIIRDAGQVRHLNDLLKQANEPQTPIKLVEGSANKYEMDLTTRTFLLSELK